VGPTAMRRSSKSRRGPGPRAGAGPQKAGPSAWRFLLPLRQVVKLRYLLEDVKQLVPIWNESAMQASLTVLGQLHSPEGILQDVADAYDEDAAIHRQAKQPSAINCLPSREQPVLQTQPQAVLGLLHERQAQLRRARCRRLCLTGLPVGASSLTGLEWTTACLPT